jgi:plastocyanin
MSTVNVNVDDPMAFNPSVVTVQQSGTVHWEWTGSSRHSVTIDHQDTAKDYFDSGVHVGPHSFEHTFNKPGAYGYHCSVHGQLMRGTVFVDMPIADDPPADPTPNTPGRCI